MIKASAELTAIVERWNDAVRRKDRSTVENLLSADAALRYVGSALGEIWGGDVLRRGLGDHFGEVPEFQYRNGTIEAYESGATGWALWHGQIEFSTTGVLSDYRITFIFVLEGGVWKIVQIHISNPTSNMDKMGIEHEALDALVAAAAKGTLGLGRAGITTIMFSDVVDSSAMADLMGDQAWTARINSHLAEVERIVTDAGGTLVKSLEDGTMSTFLSVRAAVLAAQQIQRAAISDRSEPALRLRVGLHTGEVIENKGDFFGTVVNKAARINSIAQPDEIRVSDATRIMLGRADDVVIDDPREVALKGLDGLHTVYRVMV